MVAILIALIFHTIALASASSNSGISGRPKGNPSRPPCYYAAGKPTMPPMGNLEEQNKDEESRTLSFVEVRNGKREYTDISVAAINGSHNDPVHRIMNSMVDKGIRKRSRSKQEDPLPNCDLF
jgi:hypothetical protein